ncbi:hypothetical protein EDD37DRAFT_644209 [Exophiala viscosa]|uniref:Uncharacterized protein n=1 Tax=Exophiala viscosa TaxID=2486360 RepID=A0AAN6DL10_9EURO|nr:hypothetical protein EDD36DRAFT_449388 [Exophiala viscosa]KAI1628411.1 hypothetical protein EDD37DRAFT_644209 [Exophiala viscosa]
MVTTRLQEKKSHDTPEPSTAVDLSTNTEQQTPSNPSKKRSTPRTKATQNVDAQKSLKKSARTEDSSLLDDDATPMANNKTVPIRQKPTESFFTPAQTPANKRKRFTSEELEDSTLDTFETPAEHPQSRPEQIEEEHDDDDAPEVVSSKSAAAQIRGLRSRGLSTPGNKRRKTAKNQKSAEPVPVSDTIEVVSTPATPAKKPDQDEEQETDDTIVNDQSEAEVPSVQTEDESIPQTITVSETIIVETASLKPDEEDQTQSPAPVVDDASETIDETAPTTVLPTATEEPEAEPSTDHATLDDPTIPEETSAAAQPESVSEESAPNDLASSTVREHISASPTIPETQDAFLNHTSSQLTTSTPKSTAKRAPEPQPQSRHRPNSRSSLPNRPTKLSKPSKPSSSNLSPQERVALLRGHRPGQKPKATSSLEAYRNRILDRHPRTSAWGAPGQRKVKFLGA